VTNNKKNEGNSKAEILLWRIKNKKELVKIYKFGKTVFSNDRKLKANYLFSAEENQPNVNYAVAVSSKNGKSVWRNRFKRLVRESIKIEIFHLNEIVLVSNSNLSVIFSPGSINQSNCKKIFLKDIKPSIIDLLSKIKTAVVIK
jgi:ribonuclease P protein component